MVEQDLSDCSEPFCARPITLQFSRHPKPRDRLGPRGHETNEDKAFAVCSLAPRLLGIPERVWQSANTSCDPRLLSSGSPLARSRHHNTV